MITYFILIKGAKGASFMSPHTVIWIKVNTWTILGAGFACFAVLFQGLLVFTRINILKPIVLAGTFALAMAFAANDLVNFIGVPLAGFQAFSLARAGVDPLNTTMVGLQKQIESSTLVLLAAGAVMVATLWLSRKARTVTKTEVSLGRQEEGHERFESSHLSRIVVRMAAGLMDAGTRVCSRRVRGWIRSRFNSTGYRPAAGYDGSIPEFDLMRASVNLMVASALVAWATSMKLPLSTTYVTFMVAMGTSLADQAWGRESAVYRVSGVLAVIGGWFFTAFMAFTVSLVFAFGIAYFRGVAIGLLLLGVAFLIIRNFRVHGRREEAAKELELLDLKRVIDADYAVRTCFEHSGRFLAMVHANISDCYDGILAQDRKILSRLRHETSRTQKASNVIVANIFKTLRLLEHKDVKGAGKYAYVISALQEIAESLRDMILRCYVHTVNYHSGLLPAQKAELEQVRRCVEAVLRETSRIMLTREPFRYREVAAHHVQLKDLLDQFDRSQIERIRGGLSKTRLSILFYAMNNSAMKISEQSLTLLTIFEETFPSEHPETDQDQGA